jgi:hypothetical protein
MADDVGDEEMRKCVDDGLAKFIAHETQQEREMLDETPESPPMKRQKLLKRAVSMNGIFLQALLENAPTQEGKQFIMVDIYHAIKGNAKEAGEDEGGLVKQDGEEEEAQDLDKEATPKNEFHHLEVLAQYYENLLVLPSKSRS